ncbi:MAG: SO_0444 family Cu/Zn efflux transporter [Candidatus Omnitrophica bacterium]|nr:SO_0444 family Cu/Zn efflux transporter [Candidatus Omnitrophota bacterium]
MVEIFIGIISESYILLMRMSVYLLFGYFFAGVVHIFLTPGTIARHLGGRSISSVLKASLFGIPLPLCSCGVIPAALSLRKEGAGKGAVLSFLISTPTTGIDSIFATYALLGGVFVIYRVCASFIVAFFIGIIANIVIQDTIIPQKEKKKECKVCSNGECATEKHSLLENIKGVFTYAFGTLLRDTGWWILIGILIGGAIAFFLPKEFIHTYLGTGWQAILIMLLIGMPMYVCASGSIPIAAALMLKGLNPGAAFAFLMAGPATNTVTMTVVWRHLGKMALVVYLSSIIICSFLLGLLFDFIWQLLGGFSITTLVHHEQMFPAWLEGGAAVLLLILIFMNIVLKYKKKK